jgi:hypothetical protein
MMNWRPPSKYPSLEELKALTKDTNPKDAIGATKVGLSVVPLGPIMEVALALTEGARKYGRHNYRVKGIRASIYFDACTRHLASWWEGEDIDPDSGLSHLAKAMACLVIMRDAMRNGTLTDDRPPVTEPDTWVKELNTKVEELIKKYPESCPPYINTATVTVE